MVYRGVPASLAEAVAAQEAEALAIYRAELDAEFGKGTVAMIPVAPKIIGAAEKYLCDPCGLCG